MADTRKRAALFGKSQKQPTGGTQQSQDQYHGGHVHFIHLSAIVYDTAVTQHQHQTG